eukprot:TRINITY_DN91729_c0_g1_i1.p1 TRINITY_DN91729_c0_g1~~TRINITY_DN91729_c0_g1_i1.p1  ORF type:complete len:247 (+),score=78.92 TRINITY_DN91729_c0_g1_i1:50-742(+)
MALRLRPEELLRGESLRAVLEPLLEQESPGSARRDELESVKEEARLVLSILGYVEVLGSHDEIRRIFSQTPLEAHLAEALLAGAAGELDLPRVMQALQGAAAAGSIFAPQWLAEVETLREAASEGFQADDVSAAQSSRLLAQLSQLAAGLGLAGSSGGALREEVLRDVEDIPLEELPRLEVEQEEPELPPRLRGVLRSLQAMDEASGDSKERQEDDILQMFVLKPRRSKL